MNAITISYDDYRFTPDEVSFIEEIKSLYLKELNHEYRYFILRKKNNKNIITNMLVIISRNLSDNGFWYAIQISDFIPRAINIETILPSGEITKLVDFCLSNSHR